MGSAVDLTTCRSCGAPNHPARERCGRCREPLSRGPAIFAGGDAAQYDETTAMAQVPDDASADSADADTDPSGRAVDGPEAAVAVADQAPEHETVTTDAPARSSRVLDLLRGPVATDTQPLDPTGPPPEVQPLLQRRPVLLVSVVGLALGAVVGILAASGRLPGTADGTPSTVPVFDEGVYRGEPVPIAIASVRASSQLSPAGDNTYEPELVVDGSPTTAWNSDGAGRPDGIGEHLILELAEPAWVTAIQFVNGYQRDDVRFLANARVERAALHFDLDQMVNVLLLDQTGTQQVPLPSPVLTRTIDIEITAAFPGDTYPDLAISELQVLGHVARGADRASVTGEAAS